MRCTSEGTRERARVIRFFAEGGRGNGVVGMLSYIRRVLISIYTRNEDMSNDEDMDWTNVGLCAWTTSDEHVCMNWLELILCALLIWGVAKRSV